MKISKKKLKQIYNIFMEEENEINGWKELYILTQDKLCLVLIEWLNTYNKEILELGETNEWYMYDDISSYLWEKYKLNEII